MARNPEALAALMPPIEEPTGLAAALAAIDTHASSDDAATVRATARGLMRGYDHRRTKHTWRPTGIEQQFNVPILNLNTSKQTSQSRTFRLAGKIDLDGQRDNQPDIWVMDHKTTSSEIEDPDALFWRQLVVDSQANLYLLAKHLQGVQVCGAVWDVIRKPGIRPKKLSKKDQAGIASLKTYFGFRVSEETIQGLIGGIEQEAAELYEYRLAAECSENAGRYFQQRAFVRMESELLEYAGELWDLTQEIITARRTNRWPRTPGACLQYGRPCTYLGICSHHDTPDSDKWQPRRCVHSELTVDDDGRNLLTYSRLACFQSCRRRHYYKYELGIERIDATPDAAPAFGTLMHAALSAWWRKQESTHV